MSPTRPAPSDQTAASPEWTDILLEGGAAPGALHARLYGRQHAGADAALVVHFHGGAFVAGSLDSGVAMARLLASVGAVVVSIDYPLAPAHPFPAAVEAGHAALRTAYRARAKLAGPRARLFVAGEEAGGNLAAALALVCRDRHEPPLAGQILIGPMLDPYVGTASLRRCEAGPVGCKWADGWHDYLRDCATAEHPYAAPGRATRLAGLPPSLLLTADDDPMRDETRAYAERLRAAGVAVSACELPAPTGWPAALNDAAHTPGAWDEAVCARLHEFLAAVRA
jgi:acetyl esterase/lipase